MTTSRRDLIQVYHRLYRHYGDLHWWPGETAREICVGTIFTQNTAWTNVEKACPLNGRRGVPPAK